MCIYIYIYIASPVEERLYTGSKAGGKAAWPYDLRPL